MGKEDIVDRLIGVGNPALQGRGLLFYRIEQVTNLDSWARLYDNHGYTEDQISERLNVGFEVLLRLRQTRAALSTHFAGSSLLDRASDLVMKYADYLMNPSPTQDLVAQQLADITSVVDQFNPHAQIQNARTISSQLPMMCDLVKSNTERAVKSIGRMSHVSKLSLEFIQQKAQKGTVIIASPLSSGPLIVAPLVYELQQQGFPVVLEIVSPSTKLRGLDMYGLTGEVINQQVQIENPSVVLCLDDTVSDGDTLKLTYQNMTARYPEIPIISNHDQGELAV